METEKSQERSVELRSEKVRSLVGQIPSSLTRYGIVVIGAVLSVLVAVAYFLPYKEVYAGVVVVRKAEWVELGDSIEANLRLKFEYKRPAHSSRGILLLRKGDGEVVEGRLQSLSPMRDTLDRQEAVCRFATEDLIGFEEQSIDFTLVSSSSNLLSKMLGKL